MNIDRINRNCVKFTVKIFDEEDEEYFRPSSSYFDENIFAWQKIAYQFHPLSTNWMIATGKGLPEILLKIKSKVDNLTHLYSIIRRIVEEVLCACYIDDIESLIEATISREFHWDMQVSDYCNDLLTETEKFFEILLDFYQNKFFLIEYSKK